MKMEAGYMAIDQYGQTLYLGVTKHPRRELLNRLGARHCVKQYTERKDGTSYHSGYIVGRQWFTLYKVEPFHGVQQ